MNFIINILFSIYIFSIFFPIKINQQMYLATLVGMGLVIFILLKYIHRFKYVYFNKSIWSINIACILYSLYLIIQGILLDKTFIMNITKIVPFLVLIVLLYYLKIENIYINKIIKKIKILIYIYIFGAIIARVFSIQRIDLYRIPKIINQADFYWVMPHKSALVTFIFFIIILSYVCIDNKYMRVLIYFLSTYIIFISNSKFGLFICATSWLMIIMIIIFKKIKNRYLKGSVVLFSCSSIILMIYLKIDIIIQYFYKLIGKRINELSTLGSRIFIWKSSINTIKHYLLGVGGDVKNKMMYDYSYSFTSYLSAHNSFLQGFLEGGLIGGLIFIYIFLITFLSIIKYNKYTFVFLISIVLVNQTDIGLINSNMYGYFLMFNIVYELNQRNKNRRESNEF